jgi:AcrR family transcriptional regulator
MPRTRSATTTRAAILDAARSRFGEHGYERTTLRAVASDVGVDPAMVIRYFTNKEGLFAEAASPELHLPDLTGVPHDQLTATLLPHFFRVWEHEGTFLPLLRAATSNPAAAEALRTVFRSQIVPVVSAIAPDRPVERAAMLGSQILGLVVSRYILRTPVLVEMDDEQLMRWIDPVVVQYLVGPAPRPGPVG